MIEEEGIVLMYDLIVFRMIFIDFVIGYLKILVFNVGIVMEECLYLFVNFKYLNMVFLSKGFLLWFLFSYFGFTVWISRL